MQRHFFLWLTASLFTATIGLAETDQRQFTLSVAPDLEESGLMQHLLPRFALKTGRKAELALPPAEAEIADDGTAVFARGGKTFRLRLNGENAAALLFQDWLLSTAGQAAVTGFVPASGEPFMRAPADGAATKIEIHGDAANGLEVARAHCTRCHSVTPEDRTNIGSTPSFMALRALPDWDARFSAFYALNPHPSFLRVTGISPPFDASRPPSLVPIEISQDEVEAILAYAASLIPADLGAEVEAR